MLGRAPNRPRVTEPLVTPKTGTFTREGMTVVEEMWRQIAPGFPHVPVQIDGTNTLALTPTLHDEGGATYSDGMVFTGAAANTSTGAVTASVGSLPAKRVFTLNGSTQADAGDIGAGEVHQFIYDSSLDGGSGGFSIASGLSAQLKALGAFNTNGLLVQTALATFAGRTLVPPTKGITITNPGGVAGNPTFVLADTLAAMQTLGTAAVAGIIAETGANAFAVRTLGGTGLAVASNGTGAAGNPSIAVTAAVQADQETGSSTAVAVVPGVQQFHPSAAKCWAYVTVSAGTPTLAVSYNVTSITDSGVGDLTITIATDFSSANWSSVAAIERTTAGNVVMSTKAAGTIELLAFNAADAAADPVSWNFAGYGDQ